MTMLDTRPVCPKNPEGPLVVLTLGRVSTDHQDPEMLLVQEDVVKQHLATIWGGPVKLISLGEQVSGEAALRDSYVTAVEHIEGGEVDLAILFDLSKAGRLPRFMHQFIDLCVDYDVRFISVGDNIDTDDDNWEVPAGAAVLIHGLHNRHTRNRVRGKAVRAFHKGGMVCKVPYGYRKLTEEEAATGNFGTPGLKEAKIAECTPVLREMKSRVEAGDTYESIAQWLRDEGIPSGPYARGDWTGKLVKETLRNPILHGEREFGRIKTIRKRTTGREIRKPASNFETHDWPELAHFSLAEHEMLLAEMDRRRNAHPRVQCNAKSPKGRARSATLFPGQMMTCAVCGSLYYWLGSGGLKCGSRGDPAQGGCWNHLQIDPEIVRKRMCDVLIGVFSQDRVARESLIDSIIAEFDRQRGREDKHVESLTSEIESLRKANSNLVRAIERLQAGDDNDIEDLLTRRNANRQRIKQAEDQLVAVTEKHTGKPVIPARESIDDGLLRELIRHLMGTSHEFNAVLGRTIRAFRVVPLQAVDTGKPVGRARVTFAFAPKQTQNEEEESSRLGDSSVVLDLFDPPAHIRCLNQVTDLKAAHPDWGSPRIAKAIGHGVKRWDVRGALKLLEKMEALGASEPYVPITDPATVSRWRMSNSHEPRWDQTA